MRIALVSDVIYPYHMGGKERRLDEVSRRLAAAGHDVHVYTMQWWEGERTKTEHGVHFHAICKQYELYQDERRSIKEGVMFALACFKLLGQKFDVADVDHMPYFPLYSMWLVCLLKHKPMLATWHEVWGRKYWQTYMGGLSGRIAFLIERGSIFLPKQFLAVSPFTAKRLQEEYGVKPDRITTSMNGISLDIIKASKPARVKSDLIFVGRLLAHKNVDMLVRAVAELKKSKPDVRAVVVGKGPEAKALKKLAADLGVAKNIAFVPPIDASEDLFAAMKASKVFVFPSEREGFGLIAMEANACGLPVLTLDTPANATATLITPGKNGDVFKTEMELTKLLKKYLAHGEAKRDTIVKSASQYDWNATVKPLLERYAA